MTLALTSPAFQHDGPIPQEYTCEGPDHAPELRWSGVPSGTQTLTLIVDDPDAPDPKAPKMTYVHWVVYDIPPTTTGLPKGGALPSGALEGKNDWHRVGYGGPCPPIGRHRYFFKLYALDTVLGNLQHPTKADVERAMRGHILAQAELMGTYQKEKP